MQRKTIDDLQRDVVRIYSEYQRTGTNRWTHQTALIDMQYQVGMLAKRILQLQGDRFDEGHTSAELRLAIGDELADILAEVLFIAQDLQVDIGVAWEGMLRSDEAKIDERTRFRRRRAS